MKKKLDWIKKRWRGLWRNYRLGITLSLLAVLVIVSAFIPYTNAMWEYNGGWTGEATRSIVLTLGGIGAFYGLILAARRVATAERNLFNDRFGRGAELLGHGEIRMWSIGIKLLQQLHKDADNDNDERLIHEALLDFTRHTAKLREEDKKENGEKENGEKENGEKESDDEERAKKKVRDDALRFTIKNGIYALAKIKPPNKPLELQELDLRALNLPKVDLSRAQLWKTDLSNAKLRGANLSGADLSGADLHTTHLQNALLLETKLLGATLTNANLTSANLVQANLHGANLCYANLRDANLAGANLRGANLERTDLWNTDLSGVDLKAVAQLTQQQLNQAVYDQEYPPYNIDHLTLPTNRAYEWRKDEDGNKQRWLVASGDWFDPRPAD